MRIYFPGYYTEAHRTPDKQTGLVAALAALGVECTPVMTGRIDLIFCGSFYQARDVNVIKPPTGVPIVHYNWDLYPFQVDPPQPWSNYTRIHAHWWRRYVEDLRRCRLVLVPSQCTVTRTKEFCNRDAVVVKAPYHPWEGTPFDGGWVMNVMRRYESDPNVDILKQVCDDLKIPLVEPACKASWDEYKRLVLGARVLVSPYYEASTGGLSLLEGYHHGKTVLVSNSPRNGAQEYFGDRADKFQWNNRNDLADALQHLYNPPEVQAQADPESRRRWLTQEYSESAFAARLADAFRTVVNTP